MANCGEKWTNKEETLLLERLNENMDIKEIAEKHKRTISGIKSRCKRIANNMYINNIPIDTISDKTRLSIDVIEKMTNCGKKWSDEEETLLLERLNEDMDIKEIAEKHKRTIGAIKSRCKRIAYNMYLNNVPVDHISNKTRLSINFIKGVIRKKNNKDHKIKLLRIEIEELKNKMKELKKEII